MGAAGGIIAKELSTAGHRVVVLEQGPRLAESQFDHDEFGTFMQSRHANALATQPQTFRATSKDKAKKAWTVIYGRLVGGSNAHFTGNFWRLRPGDFNEASALGGVPGTGLADWPITYDELEPYYTRAEWELGVSGEPGPFDPPRSRPYPMPPLPVKSSGVLLERGARALGLHPQPSSMAINSIAYNGRPPCQHCGFCLFFMCEYRAKSTSMAAGALKIWPEPIQPKTQAVHLLGTCRMGADPRTSVVDPYHRAHDVPNLFICDGSSLVTSSRGQPTATISALAFRAGEHFAALARRGEI